MVEQTLTETAIMLRRSYPATLRLLLVGALRGRRTPAGRYVVERASAEEFARQEETDGQSPR